MDTALNKRLGAYNSLRGLYETNITVNHILEKLEAYGIDEDASEAAQKLAGVGFDVVGIKENGVATGYAKTVDLAKGGLCGDHLRPFHTSDLISSYTPLLKLFDLLRQKKRLFVLDKNEVNGIVNRADLQKPPVAMLLFGMITLLELHFLLLIREKYENESWKRFLSERRLQYATALFEERRSRNEEIDLADCLQFCDKRELVVRNEGLRVLLGASSRRALESDLKEIEKIRNRLAHAQDLVSGSSWDTVFRTIECCEALLKNCESQFGST